MVNEEAMARLGGGAVAPKTNKRKYSRCRSTVHYARVRYFFVQRNGCSVISTQSETSLVSACGSDILDKDRESQQMTDTSSPEINTPRRL